MKLSEMITNEIKKKYWAEFDRLKMLYPDFTNKCLYEMLEANQGAVMYSTYGSFRVAYHNHLKSKNHAEQI